MDYKIEKDLLVVKVGTSVLVEKDGGEERLNEQTFRRIGQEVLELSDDGNGVILVSSGAVTAGVFNGNVNRDDIVGTSEEQRLAARGWDIVVQKWKASIGDQRVSSSLLTRRELADKTSIENLLGVIACCLSHDDIFLVNENDCLSSDELKFGDNDILAASLASVLSATGWAKTTRLVMLTDRRGLNTVENDDSTLIRSVASIDSVEEFASQTTNCHSRGGMASKLDAARIAKTSKVEAYIASGYENSAVAQAIAGKTGTHFIV